VVLVPRILSISLALRNTALSGKIARTNAANKETPDAHQNRLLHPDLVDGTRNKLITAAMRYPTA
jgi:hypothetical protein